MPTPGGRPATVVVTGGNAGLGQHAARAILSDDPGWHVVLACRDVERAETARRELTATADRARGGDPERVGVVRSTWPRWRPYGPFPRPWPPAACRRRARWSPTPASRSSTSTTARPTGSSSRSGSTISATTCSPGCSSPSSPHRHGSCSWPAAPTTPRSGRRGFPDPAWSDADTLAHPPPDPGRAGPRAGRVAYATSKLATVYTAYELARRLGPARGITCVAYDPGLMPGTGLGRDYPPAQRFVWRRLMPALRLLPGVTGAPVAGRRLARLVTDPRLAHLDGVYVELGRVTRSSEKSYDRARAAALWEESTLLVGLEARV